MIIRGQFMENAPFFAAHVKVGKIEGDIWFLADTGASRTTLLDRDVTLLSISDEDLKSSDLNLTGIGGSVCSYLLRDAEITFGSDEGDYSVRIDLCVVKHDLQHLPDDEVARILRLPSLIGRDLISKFHFICNYQKEKAIFKLN